MLAKNVLKVSAISLSSVIILSFPTNVILLDHNITLLFSVILFFTCFSMFQVPILQSTSCHNRPRYFFIYKKTNDYLANNPTFTAHAHFAHIIKDI